MKKIFSLLIALSLVLTLTACGSEDTTNDNEVEDVAVENENNEDVDNTGDENSADSEVDEAEDTEENDVEPIELSYYMSKDEIIDLLGDDYTFETQDDGGYFMYFSTLAYDGIVFTYFHDEKEILPDNYPGNISIKSDKYKYDFDFRVGDAVEQAYEYCQSNLENMYDMHNDVNVDNSFIYEENGESTGVILSFEYEGKGQEFGSVGEYDEDTKIQSINLMGFYD